MSVSKTKKETGPTLKKNASMIQDDNKRNRPMWQLETTIQYLIAEKKPL